MSTPFYTFIVKNMKPAFWTTMLLICQTHTWKAFEKKPQRIVLWGFCYFLDTIIDGVGQRWFEELVEPFGVPFTAPHFKCLYFVFVQISTTQC